MKNKYCVCCKKEIFSRGPNAVRCLVCCEIINYIKKRIISEVTRMKKYYPHFKIDYDMKIRLKNKKELIKNEKTKN